MTETLILTGPERRTKAGLMPSLLNPAWTAGREASTSGLYAEMQLDPLTIVAVSKLDGESGWTIDAMWRNGCPAFSNGYGARYLITRRLSDELGAELDGRLADDAIESAIEEGWTA